MVIFFFISETSPKVHNGGNTSKSLRHRPSKSIIVNLPGETRHMRCLPLSTQQHADLSALASGLTDVSCSGSTCTAGWYYSISHLASYRDWSFRAYRIRILVDTSLYNSLANKNINKKSKLFLLSYLSHCQNWIQPSWQSQLWFWGRGLF